MAGLLDWINTPEGAGLLSAVAGGMAGARRGEPVNTIGRGLASGLMGYHSTQDQLLQQQRERVAEQYRQMQMDQMKQQMVRKTRK
jgi:hypothetical protein